jgi:hypothetical protein
MPYLALRLGDDDDTVRCRRFAQVDLGVEPCHRCDPVLANHESDLGRPASQDICRQLVERDDGPASGQRREYQHQSKDERERQTTDPNSAHRNLL